MYSISAGNHVLPEDFRAWNAAYISRGMHAGLQTFANARRVHTSIVVLQLNLRLCGGVSTWTRALSRFPGGPSSRSWPEDIQRGRSAIIIAISGSPRGESAAAILDASGGGGRGAASGSILEDLYIAGALGSELSRTPASTALTPQLQL